MQLRYTVCLECREQSFALIYELLSFLNVAFAQIIPSKVQTPVSFIFVDFHCRICAILRFCYNCELNREFSNTNSTVCRQTRTLRAIITQNYSVRLMLKYQYTLGTYGILIFNAMFDSEIVLNDSKMYYQLPIIGDCFQKHLEFE